MAGPRRRAPPKRRRDHASAGADHHRDPLDTRGVYVVFLTERGWDFTDARTYSGPRRPREYEIHGLAEFMAWANRHLRLSRTKPLDDAVLDRMIARLEGNYRKGAKK